MSFDPSHRVTPAALLRRARSPSAFGSSLVVLPGPSQLASFWERQCSGSEAALTSLLEGTGLDLQRIIGQHNEHVRALVFEASPGQGGGLSFFAFCPEGHEQHLRLEGGRILERILLSPLDSGYFTML